jgi:putative transposase
MARKPREEVPGGVFHVFARGNAKQPIYLDDLDRRWYLQLLGRVVSRARWHCLGYCQMNNHVHLVLETPEANLAFGMQRLHGRYAESFNARHERSGHLFQGRYGAVRITNDEQLIAAMAYLAVNPVTAGLCARPEDWPWGSHTLLLGGHGPPWLAAHRVLELFGAFGDDPRGCYREYVEERLEIATPAAG